MASLVEPVSKLALAQRYLDPQRASPSPSQSNAPGKPHGPEQEHGDFARLVQGLVVRGPAQYGPR